MFIKRAWFVVSGSWGVDGKLWTVRRFDNVSEAQRTVAEELFTFAWRSAAVVSVCPNGDTHVHFHMERASCNGVAAIVQDDKHLDAVRSELRFDPLPEGDASPKLDEVLNADWPQKTS